MSFKILLLLLFGMFAIGDNCRGIERALYITSDKPSILIKSSHTLIAEQDHLHHATAKKSGYITPLGYKTQAMQLYFALASHVVIETESFNLDQNQVELTSSAANEVTQALGRLSQLAIDSQDRYWLNVSGELGSGSALYYSALVAEKKSQRLHYLKKAAALNHPQGQFELAMLESEPKSRVLLLSEAASLGYAPAIIALGKHYFERGLLSEAQRWLVLASVIDALSAHKLGRLYWLNGERKKSLNAFQLALKQGYLPAKGYIHILQNKAPVSLSAWLNMYEPAPLPAPQLSMSVSPSTMNKAAEAPYFVPKYKRYCLQTIEVVATSLSSMVQARQFLQQFENDPRLTSLPICLQSPKWLSKGELKCSAKPKNNGRLSCDLLAIAEKKPRLDFSHLIVFAEEGKANVDNGVMYLDKADVYSVFVHELAHFAGFVDEYALGGTLAEYHCNNNQAPNMILLDDVDYQPLTRARQWQTFIEQHNQMVEPLEHVSIGGSKTCKNTSLNAFKPSDKMTFMEFHDIDYIPQVYLSLWRKQLHDASNQQAININLANAAWESNNAELANYWESQ